MLGRIVIFSSLSIAILLRHLSPSCRILWTHFKASTIITSVAWEQQLTPLMVSLPQLTRTPPHFFPRIEPNLFMLAR